MNIIRSLLFMIIIAGLFIGPVAAFIIHSSVSNTDDQTRLVKWEKTPVDFVVDGGTLNGQDGLPLVLAAMDEWDNVKTAKQLVGTVYVYRQNGHLVDFNLANLGIDYGIINDGVNEIVFDETGDILQELGLDPNTVSGIGITVEDTFTGLITDVMLVVNGTITSSYKLDTQTTVTHELGHIWGLAHTFIGAINDNNNEQGFFPLSVQGIPTMYPFPNPVDDTIGRELASDDIAAISYLYPETSSNPPSQIPFGSTTGTIKGKVMYKGLLPLTAVHVKAVKVTSPTMPQIGCLSGFRADGTGEFEIPNLAPGSYYLVIEAIDGRDGVTSANIEDDGIGACCIKGFTESFTPNPIAVIAGQVVSGIQFDISELPLTDNDAIEFTFPDSFSFNFADKNCHRLFLYSNGFISLNRYESPTTPVANPDDAMFYFLSRPMAKVAPLLCDLNPQGNIDHKIDIQRNSGILIFSFHNVPLAQGSGQATFDLSLYNSGAFKFDFGDTGGVSALVGYSGGVFASGGMESSFPLADFLDSTVPSTHNLLMFQILDTTSLKNHSLYFPKPATDPFPVRNRLLYPWLAVNNFFTMGLAVVSNSDTNTRLRLTAYDIDGHLLPVNAGSTNPAYVNLGPYEQFVSQISQVFSFTGNKADGWVLVETDNPDPYGIQGFFLAQSFFNNILDSLDGAIALADADTTVIFPRYTGGQDSYTEVTVVNPNPFANDITLHLYKDDGTEKTVTDRIPPNGASIITLNETANGYVVVDGSEPLAGFTMNFNLAGSLAGQASQFRWEARSELVSPHFIWNSSTFASKLDIANPNNDPANVTIALTDSNGQAVGHTKQLTINGWYNATVDLSPANFGFSPSTGADGWVRVTADRPLLGTMSFGDHNYQYYQTTLPLLWQPLYWTLHSHVAQGNAGGVGYLTGLAALSLEPANTVYLDLYSSQGTRLESVGTTLGAGQRQLGLLDWWMPQGPWPRIGGYLTGQSSAGMYAYEIFTTADSQFFAAVPSQRFLPIQYETNDTNNGWPEQAVELDWFPVEVRGQVTPGDNGFFVMKDNDGYTDTIEDLYKFSVTKTGRFIFGLYPDNRYGDMDLYLFNSTHNIIQSATNGVPGVEYIEVDLTPGTYYIGVSLLDMGWFNTLGYWLTVEPDAIPG